MVIGTSVFLDLASYLHLTPQHSSVGAGHNGLVLAARLLQLGVKVLCVELNARPGDFWRQRCESLLLEVYTEGERLTVAPKQTRPSASTSLSGRVISTPRMANPNVTHNLTYRPPSVHGVSEAVADLHACCCASSSRRLSRAPSLTSHTARKSATSLTAMRIASTSRFGRPPKLLEPSLTRPRSAGPSRSSARGSAAASSTHATL